MKTLRAWLLARLLTPAERYLLAGINRPDRWQADRPLTKQECDNWKQFLDGPLGGRIDHTMINWIMQEAQRAQQAPTADLIRMVGYAHGIRAGWEMAKTLSRLAVSEHSANEEPSPTAEAGLEHHQP